MLPGYGPQGLRRGGQEGRQRLTALPGDVFTNLGFPRLIFITEKLFIRPSLSTQYPRASLWQGLPNCVLCGQMVPTWCLQQASVTLDWAATLLSPEELNCLSCALVLVALAITLHPDHQIQIRQASPIKDAYHLAKLIGPALNM